MLGTISIMNSPSESMDKLIEDVHWFVMRDLKRPNAKYPAYKMLSDLHFEVFTPMRWKLSIRKGKKIRQESPFLPDLLFVRSSSSLLDPVVKENSTLQYRFVKGGKQNERMLVRDNDMERFIHAVQATDHPVYYLPEEIKPEQCHRQIRIIGGQLNGYEGRLLSIKGSRKKHLLVELPGQLSVGVEVASDYIQFIE